MANFTVTIENGSYVVKFPYDPQAVNAIKASIPATARLWDGARKCWIIAGEYKKQAEIALEMNFPDIAKAAPKTETRLLEVRYLGACKERAPGDVSAMGLLKSKAWGAVFPEQVLRAWFDDDRQLTPAGESNLYALLGVKMTDGQDEIKSGYRRMARQWHPDVCREPDANKMFLRIREAYDILSNPYTRSRYDAGLALEASINQNFSKGSSVRMDFAGAGVYRSPLRCGYILAEGQVIIGRFVVSKILSWDDITDTAGRTLVSSWRMGDNAPTESWV